MNKKNYYLVLLLIGSSIISCETDDLEYKNDFKTSKNSWLNFKKTTDNSYKYKVTNSTWIGISWETLITITNGKVTQRAFKYVESDELDKYNLPEDKLEWVENENNIGSHDQTSAAKAITLDDVYNKAQQEWLVPRKDTKTYFETENNGLISLCGYVNNSCADDCFIGIRIQSIEAL